MASEVIVRADEQALQGLSPPDVQTGMALPQHWMRDFFLASLCLDLQHNEEALGRLQVLTSTLPVCIIPLENRHDAGYVRP